MMKGKVEKSKAEKRKAELQGKEEEAKPANHKNVRLFGVRRAEAQRNEDEDYEGKHSFGRSAGSSVFGQGVRGSLARQNADGGISRRDFCGQRFKDDTGKLFKNDGGEDFETRSGENSDDGEGKCTSKSGGENFHSGKGFGNAGGVFVLGLGGGLIDQDAGDGHHKVNIVSQTLKARVAGFASKHGLDQTASAKLRGTTDGVAWDVVEHGISGRVRNPSAYVSRMVTAKDCCWDNEEQWVDDDWTEDKVGGQCTEETVMGEDGEQETEVTGEGEHGDQFAGGLVNTRTVRAGIGQRSAWMITPSDGAWTWRGATMVGRPIATTRGITTAITTTMRKATAMTTKRLGIEGEPSVPPWMLFL